jgi:phosphoribosyl 1,2-cyclic phosphodiesterase
LTLRGARGSEPSVGARASRHGGHTTCLDVGLSERRRVVLDCGTGLRLLGAALPDDPGPGGIRFDVFLTHYHWDHLAGLPLFRGLQDPRNRVVIHGASFGGKDVQGLLEEALGPPWLPVGIEDMPASIEYEELVEGTTEIEDLVITARRLHHPQGVFGFRLERGGRSVVLATDHERGDPRADDALLALSRGADVLIHDAQYTPEEYLETHRGWGHSTWRHAVDAAREAGAGRLLLCHHDPRRSDDEIDAIVEAARRVFPATDAASEGLTFPL